MDLLMGMRYRLGAWLVGLDVGRLGIYRALDTLLGLPPSLLAVLAQKESDGQDAKAAPEDNLTGSQADSVGSGGTSTAKWGLGSTTHLSTDDKAGWLTAKFSEEDRRCSVWVRRGLFESNPGYYTGLLDPADLKRIVVKVVEDYERFPG